MRALPGLAGFPHGVDGEAHVARLGVYDDGILAALDTQVRELKKLALLHAVAGARHQVDQGLHAHHTHRTHGAGLHAYHAHGLGRVDPAQGLLYLELLGVVAAGVGAEPLLSLDLAHFLASFLASLFFWSGYVALKLVSQADASR